MADREVDSAQAELFAKNNDLSFFEVSAKTGHNIQSLFRNIANRLQKKYSPEEEDPTSTKPKPSEPKINIADPQKQPQGDSKCRC